MTKMGERAKIINNVFRPQTKLVTQLHMILTAPPTHFPFCHSITHLEKTGDSQILNQIKKEKKRKSFTDIFFFLYIYFSLITQFKRKGVFKQNA